MDPRGAFTSACVLIVGLLGATRLSSGAKCKCSDIPEVELTVRKDDCFDTKDRHRYECIPGYVRKAGNSSLIRCEEKDGTFQWSIPKMKCIPDPKIPLPTSREGTTTSLPSVRTSTSEDAKSINTGTSTNLQYVRTSTSEAAKSSNTKTSTLGTSTNLQHVRTSTSEAAKSSNRETTTLGTSTNLQYVRTSTSEAAKSSNTKTSTLGEGKGLNSEGDTKAGYISLSVVVLLFAICCIIILLYRRKIRKIPPREAEELEPMNDSEFTKESHSVNRQRDI